MFERCFVPSVNADQIAVDSLIERKIPMRGLHRRFPGFVLCAVFALALFPALAGQDHRPKFELKPVGSVLVFEGDGAPVPAPLTGTESSAERNEFTRRREDLRKICAEDARIYGRNGREFLLLEYRDVPQSRRMANGTTITDEYIWAHVRSNTEPACDGWMELNGSSSLFRAGASASNEGSACLPDLSEKDCPAGYKGETVCSASAKRLVCTATGTQRVSDDWRCPISDAKPRVTRRGQVFCSY